MKTKTSLMELTKSRSRTLNQDIPGIKKGESQIEGNF